MATFHGVVTLDETKISVDLGLDGDTIKLIVDGNEVGVWSPDECSIENVDDGVYTINAENESLLFVPSDPAGFAEGLNGGREPEPVSSESSGQHRQVPPPRPVTMVLFYVLSAVTALLGLWALVSLLL